MAGISGCLRSLGNCLIVLLKFYHAIMFMLLSWATVHIVSSTSWISTIGLCILSGNNISPQVWAVTSMVVFTCATVIGLFGWITKGKVINSLFFLLALYSLCACVTFNQLGFYREPFAISEHRFNELASMMKYVEWDETKSEALTVEADQATRLWTSIQQTLGCCGLDNYRNWTNFKPPALPSRYLPSSCCSFGDRKSYKDHFYCPFSPDEHGQIEEDSVYPSCLSQAKKKAYSSSDNFEFLYFAMLQLHQAIINIAISCVRSGSGKAAAKY